MLLVEQNAHVALGVAHYGYILENGRIVVNGPTEKLLSDPDVQRFYLGTGDEGEGARELSRRQALQAAQALAVLERSFAAAMNRAEDLKELPLPQQLLHWAKVRPDMVALRQKEFGRLAAGHLGRVRAAIALVRARPAAARPCSPGRASPCSGENCKEWVYAEFGAALVGAITAGVYPTSPAEEVEYLLALSEAPIIVCADQEQFDKVLSIRTRLPSLRAIVVINPRGLRRYDRTSFYEFDEVVALGQRVEAEDPTGASSGDGRAVAR
jgi:hypothetical protein